jgi:hypothetical protein
MTGSPDTRKRLALLLPADALEASLRVLPVPVRDRHRHLLAVHAVDPGRNIAKGVPGDLAGVRVYHQDAYRGEERPAQMRRQQCHRVIRQALVVDLQRGVVKQVPAVAVTVGPPVRFAALPAAEADDHRVAAVVVLDRDGVRVLGGHHDVAGLDRVQPCLVARAVKLKREHVPHPPVHVLQCRRAELEVGAVIALARDAGGHGL